MVSSRDLKLGAGHNNSIKMKKENFGVEFQIVIRNILVYMPFESL